MMNTKLTFYIRPAFAAAFSHEAPLGPKQTWRNEVPIVTPNSTSSEMTVAISPRIEG
jgi:hypothetical protein